MAGAHPRTSPAPRRRARRSPPPRRKKPRWLPRIAVAAGAVVAALFGWAALARTFAPVANASLDRFDAIIVLGYPADSDGNPTPTQLSRVTEAVREYKRGIAPRLIVTGGAAHNQFAEAQVMARTAEAQGLPPSAVFVEPRALDTIQDACYAVRIMQAHGWTSAEVVSSPSHLPRASLIFSRLPIEWRMHPAPSLEPSSPMAGRFRTVLETLRTVHYLVWARWGERCQP